MATLNDIARVDKNFETLFRQRAAAGASPPAPRSVDELKGRSEIRVQVLSEEHANCDSLPLRFGVHFPSDKVVTLKRPRFLKVDPTYPDRFHFGACLLCEDGREHSGHFVIGERRGFTDPVLVTVWCSDDLDTEHRLSEVMTALRKRGLLTPQMLLEWHPLYRQGRLATHADLVAQLARKLSAEQLSVMQSAVDEAVAKAGAAIAERDRALDRERQARESERQHAARAAGLQSENEALREELAAERSRHETEKAHAQLAGQKVTLSAPDALVAVLEDQFYRGSSCTILVMGDGSRRFMKTATFDRDRRVTAKAKTLIGRRVQVSGWDPLNEPGKWTSQGYFRNVYAAN